MNLFTTIEEFIPYANVKASMPFDKLQIHIVEAIETVERYIGPEMVRKACDDADMRELLRRAVAPLAVSTAAPELSLNFGDAGHTVSKSDKTAPASDAKIEAYVKAAYIRGMRALDALIKTVSSDESFSSWPDNPLNSTNLMGDYQLFCRLGNGIGHVSPLLFGHLHNHISDAEIEEIYPVTGAELFEQLKSDITPGSELYEVKRTAMTYIANSALLRWSEVNDGADPYLDSFVLQSPDVMRDGLKRKKLVLENAVSALFGETESGPFATKGMIVL